MIEYINLEDLDNASRPECPKCGCTRLTAHCEQMTWFCHDCSLRWYVEEPQQKESPEGV